MTHDRILLLFPHLSRVAQNYLNRYRAELGAYGAMWVCNEVDGLPERLVLFCDAFDTQGLDACYKVIRNTQVSLPDYLTIAGREAYRQNINDSVAREMASAGKEE